MVLIKEIYCIQLYSSQNVQYISLNGLIIKVQCNLLSAHVRVLYKFSVFLSGHRAQAFKFLQHLLVKTCGENTKCPFGARVVSLN